MPEARQFSDFLRAVVAQPPGKDPATVIGGQAVNFWCEQAQASEPELAKHQPFTSRDLDMVAQNKAQTLAIAKATGLKLIEQSQAYSGTDRAALIDTTTNEPLIQILGGMFGVSNKELDDNTVDVAIFDSNGHEYRARLANQTSLLKGKIALALAPDGMRSPEDKEHDRFHLKLLIMCIAVAGKNLIEGIGKTHDERFVINSLKALQKVIGSKEAARVAAIDSEILWKNAIADAIVKTDSARFPKLARYVSKEIVPWTTSG